MKKPAFKQSISQCCSVLKDLDLLEAMTYAAFESDLKDLKSLEYDQLWEQLYLGDRFNFRLVDGSLFIFHFRLSRSNKFEPSYYFMDSPREGDELRPHVLPLRYDVDHHGYEAGVHPVSHLHVGMGDDWRLASRRILSPLAFLLFVIRHHYPDKWRDYLASTGTPHVCKNVRDRLEEVDISFFGTRDLTHMYLA